MNLYGFLRFGVIPIAIIGWVLYQFIIKKKKFEDFKGDFFAALFMVGVYLLLIYWIVS
jgi:hypothetical protein